MMPVLVKAGENAVKVDNQKDTRTRMVSAAIEGLQRRGVAGMSFSDVLACSGAARGAIYHHFPGGKTQLVAEAARRNGDDIRIYLTTLSGSSPVEVVEAFLAAIRPVVASSAAGGGCAVAAVTVDVADNGPGARSGGTDGKLLQDVAATAFSSWIDALADRLEAAGSSAEDAHDLAATLIAVLEGAHVLCRAAGNIDPFESAARTVISLAHGGASGPPLS